MYLILEYLALSVLITALWCINRGLLINLLRVLVPVGLVAGVLALGGCAHKESFFANADTGSTAAGLMSGSMVEANPLGYATLPAKAALLNYVDKEPCHSRNSLKSAYSGMWGGAAVNNVALIAGVGAFALPVGIAAGFIIGMGNDGEDCDEGSLNYRIRQMRSAMYAETASNVDSLGR